MYRFLPVVLVAVVVLSGCKRSTQERAAADLAELRLHSLSFELGGAYGRSGGPAEPALEAPWGRDPLPPKAAVSRKVAPAFSIARVPGASNDEGTMGDHVGSLLSKDGKPDGTDPDCSFTWTPEGDDAGALEAACAVGDVKATRRARVTCTPSTGVCTEKMF